MANPAAIMSTLIKVDGMTLAVNQMKDYDALSRKAAAGADVMSASVARQDSKLKTLAVTAKSTGSTLTTHLTVPMVLIGGIAIKMASDYGMAINKIATLSSGSAKDVNMLRDAVLQLGGETAKTPKELADALYIIESGGIHGKAALDLLTESAKASAVGLGNTSVIARGATGVLNAFAAQGVTAKQVVDDMGMAIKLGMVPTEELASTLGRVSVVAATMGISVESMLGSIAAMTRVGVPAAVAAQQLRTAMVGFEKPAKSVNDALDSVGLSAEKVRDSFKKVGVQGTFEMLWAAAGKGAKNLDGQTAKYATFFQAIQRGGIAALQAVGGDAAANDAIMKSMAGHVDIIGASFKRLQQQPFFQLQAGLQSIKNDLIILGEVLLPIIAPALVKVANAIQTIGIWFHSLDPLIQKVLLGLAGFLVIVGPLVSLVGSLAAVFSAFGIVAGALGIGLLPFLAIIAAIAAGAYLIISNWSAIKPVLQPVFDWITGAVALVKDVIKGLFGGDVSTTEGANWALKITAIWYQVKADAVSAFNSIRSAINDTIQWITNAWGNATNWIRTAWNNTTSWIVTAWRNAYNYIAPTVSDIANIFRGMFSIVKAVATPFIAVLLGISNIVIGIFGPALTGVADTIKNIFIFALQLAINEMKFVANVVGTVFVHAFQLALSILGPVIKGMGALISGGMDVIRGVIKVFAGLFQLDFHKMWDGITLIWTGAWKMLKGTVTAGLNIVWDVLKAAWGTFYSIGKYLITGIGSGIHDAWKAVVGVAQDFLTALLAPINFVLGKVGVGAIKVNFHAQGGIQKAATGQKVTAPGYFAGEEAPNHPEYILATNPAYRKRNIGLWQQAGGALGIPGFALGGVAGEVQGLAAAAGFNPVAIAGLLGNAQQESTMNPNAPGGGLWQQVTNFGLGTGGTVLNQWNMMLSQIRGLIAPMNAAGSPAQAADIFERGFEHAGTPAMANRENYATQFYKELTGTGGGSILGAIGGLLGGVASAVWDFVKHPLPKIPGGVPGFVKSILTYPLKKVGDFFSGMLGIGGGAPGGTSTQGLVKDPSDGLVSAWIEQILNWARSKGWGGTVSSGYRSLAEQTAIYNSGVRPAAVPGTSHHEGINFPSGAVDVTQAAQLSNVLLGGPYAKTLVWAGSKDPVHFSHPSAGGYAKGGMYAGSFAKGGMVNATRPTIAVFGENGPETAMFIPGYAAGGVSGYFNAAGTPTFLPAVTAALSGIANPVVGYTGPTPTWEETMLGMPRLPSVGAAPTTIGGINAMLGKVKGYQTTIGGLQGQYSILDSYYTSPSQTQELVFSSGPNMGQLNQPAIDARIAQLVTLQGIAQQIFGAYQFVVAYTQLIMQGYRNVMAKLRRDLANINNAENKLKGYRDRVQDELLPSLRKQLAAIHTTGLKGAALKSAHDHQTKLRDEITMYTRMLSQAKAGITIYDKQKSGINTTLGTYQSALDSTDVQSALTDRDNAWLDLLNVKTEAGGVLSGAQATAAGMAPAASMAASAADTTAAGTTDNSALMQQMLTQSQQMYAVSQAQYATLNALPPFGGSFAEGGIVPGPLGSPRTIIAHGGEPIGGAIQVHVHVHDGAVDPNKIQVIAEKAAIKVTRGQSRTGTKASLLPGGRGGM